MNSRRQRRRALPTEPVSVVIESLSHEGRGVGHIEGKVAFVDGALPGETVQARYVRRRSQLDELAAIAIENPAPERVEPGCDFAGVCGGCSLRHFGAEHQLAFKESVLLEKLHHAAGLDQSQFEVLPRMFGDGKHYRRKARLAVRYVAKKGGALVGFREKYSSFITVMDDCQVLHGSVAKLILPLKALLSDLHAATQIPQIEVAVGESASGGIDEDQVALVFRHLEALPDGDMEKLAQFCESRDIHFYLQPGGPATVHKHSPPGEPRLSYYLHDFNLQMQFHPQDFTQVNASINRQIVRRTVELLELEATDKVLDLFCGLGNFTLPMARHSELVVGVEGSNEMVKRGYENASLNDLANVEFHSADLTKPDSAQTWVQRRYNKVVLDPPRSGALEVIPHIAQWKPEKLLYISCNPATLARDTAELLQQGYQLNSAGVMDMFPHTTHVESMAVFTPK